MVMDPSEPQSPDSDQAQQGEHDLTPSERLALAALLLQC